MAKGHKGRIMTESFFYSLVADAKYSDKKSFLLEEKLSTLSELFDVFLGGYNSRTTVKRKPKTVLELDLGSNLDQNQIISTKNELMKHLFTVWFTQSSQVEVKKSSILTLYKFTLGGSTDC